MSSLKQLPYCAVCGETKNMVQHVKDCKWGFEHEFEPAINLSSMLKAWEASKKKATRENRKEAVEDIDNDTIAHFNRKLKELIKK